MTKVKEVMTKNPVTVEASATVLDAVKLMNQKGFSGLIVVDKGKLAGLISERSLLRRFVAMDR
ncbi:MAG: CBS domain-containing protein, partial [Candidatus Bathyarchaeia archaeon]